MSKRLWERTKDWYESERTVSGQKRVFQTPNIINIKDKEALFIGKDKKVYHKTKIIPLNIEITIPKEMRMLKHLGFTKGTVKGTGNYMLVSYPKYTPHWTIYVEAGGIIETDFLGNLRSMPLKEKRKIITTIKEML